MSIVRGLFLNLLAYLGIGALTAQPIEVIPIIYWLGLLVFVRFVFGLLYFPAKFYTDQKRETNKLTFKDVEIKKYKFPFGHHIGVGLQLLSNKPQTASLTNVVAAASITQKGIPINQEVIKLPLLSKSPAGFQPCPGILNRRDQDKLNELTAIVMANWNENGAWIVEIDGQKRYFLEENVICIVRIAINGELIPPLAGAKLQECLIYCDLLYSKNRKGQKEVSIIRMQRFPEYEY